MKSLHQMLKEFDPQQNLGGAHLTGDIFGRIYIPRSLHANLMLAYAKRNKSEFLNLCIRDAHNGSSDAVALLSLMAYNGFLDCGKQRLERARELAEVAHRAKNSFGTFVLALVELEEGEHSLAHRLLAQSAKAGFPAAAWFAAKMMEIGIGVGPDYEGAIEYYKLSRARGYLYGDISYADLVRQGPSGFLQKSIVTILSPFFRLKFEVRNLFGRRFNATHLTPRIAVENLSCLAERSGK